jgi:hypothetical protein
MQFTSHSQCAGRGATPPIAHCRPFTRPQGLARARGLEPGAGARGWGRGQGQGL